MLFGNDSTISSKSGILLTASLVPPVDPLFNFLQSIVDWCVKHDNMFKKFPKFQINAKTVLPVKRQVAMMVAIIQEYRKHFRCDTTDQHEERVRLYSIENLSCVLMPDKYFETGWSTSLR